MRISIPIDVWDPGRGGAERYLDQLSRALAERGHEVTVICLRAAAGAPHPRVRIEGLRVPRFPRWLRELRFAEESARAHRRSGRDLLLAVRHALEADVYQPHGGSLRAAREAAARSLPPLARQVRRLAGLARPSLHALLWLDREVFRRSPRLVTASLSAKVEEDLRRVYPGVPFRFERVPGAVDTARFHDRDRSDCAARLRSRFAIPPGARVALFAAHRFRPKGLLHALEALVRVPAWHLVVAGRDRPAPFARAAARLGVLERCRFAGPVSDLRELLAGADTFVLPTYYDPCSLAVLEALACGTPAVTTRENGAAERIEPGVSGFVLACSGDVGGLASALEETADRWRDLHEGALAARPRLEWGRHVERMEEVLERACDRSP
ncbi:MAG: glycosyltransferase family 4 protein [Planctomycetes bacterium]|nr:glycosyltransferase family 4 protein [Planctomycetota bacterium]